MLSGEVSDVRVPERAAEVAQLHAEKIANLIKVVGNQQVQLEVKFAEVSRSGLREMGFNFFHQDAGGRFVGGMANPGSRRTRSSTVPGTGTRDARRSRARAVGRRLLALLLGPAELPVQRDPHLLESSGLAKMLAEPTLVAMSGQEAKFLVGGEFPIPMSTGLGAVSVQWKKFGIILAFTPDRDRRRRAAPEAGDRGQRRRSQPLGHRRRVLDPRPDLAAERDHRAPRRRAELRHRRPDVRPHAVDRSTSIPLLGDLPILGALFRSVSYQRDESELLVVVTAHLARPVAPHEAPHLPTDDELNDPNDFQLFLFGSEGRRPGLERVAHAATNGDGGGRQTAEPRGTVTKIAARAGSSASSAEMM